MLLSNLMACGKNKDLESSSYDSLEPLIEDKSAILETSSGSENMTESAPGTVGLVTMYPNTQMDAIIGGNSLTFYFQNNGIMHNNGNIGLYDAATNEIIAFVNSSDKEHCIINPIDEAGKNLTGWENGTMATLYFTDSNSSVEYCFEKGKSYYVLMDEGCFKLDSIPSAAVTNVSSFSFKCAQYGLSGSLVQHYKVGDIISFNVLVDGNSAVLASIKDYDSNLLTVNASDANGTACDISALKDTSTINISFLKDAVPSITVCFYNSSGKEIDSVTLNFAVGNSEYQTKSNETTSVDDLLYLGKIEKCASLSQGDNIDDYMISVRYGDEISQISAKQNGITIQIDKKYENYFYDKQSKTLYIPMTANK